MFSSLKLIISGIFSTEKEAHLAQPQNSTLHKEDLSHRHCYGTNPQGATQCKAQAPGPQRAGRAAATPGVAGVDPLPVRGSWTMDIYLQQETKILHPKYNEIGF